MKQTVRNGLKHVRNSSKPHERDEVFPEAGAERSKGTRAFFQTDCMVGETGANHLKAGARQKQQQGARKSSRETGANRPKGLERVRKKLKDLVNRSQPVRKRLEHA